MEDWLQEIVIGSKDRDEILQQNYNDANLTYPYYWCPQCEVRDQEVTEFYQNKLACMQATWNGSYFSSFVQVSTAVEEYWTGFKVKFFDILDKQVNSKGKIFDLKSLEASSNYDELKAKKGLSETFWDLEQDQDRISIDEAVDMMEEEVRSAIRYKSFERFSRNIYSDSEPKLFKDKLSLYSYY